MTLGFSCRAANSIKLSLSSACAQQLVIVKWWSFGVGKGHGKARLGHGSAAAMAPVRTACSSSQKQLLAAAAADRGRRSESWVCA